MAVHYFNGTFFKHLTFFPYQYPAYSYFSVITGTLRPSAICGALLRPWVPCDHSRGPQTMR